jgi:hypothetical protein
VRKFLRHRWTSTLPAAMAALLLALQGLIPAAALVHRPAEQLELCTAKGLKRVAAPGEQRHQHGFGGLACEQCVMASLAALGAAPPQTPLPGGWSYEAPALPTPSAAPMTARAPPRPPSRAPPAFA